MDVTFTNVLEGARQYFQGLPTGSNSAVSPDYSSEAHLRNDYDQGVPPASTAYWSSQAAEAVRSQSREQMPPQREHTTVQREHAPMLKDHTSIHRPASHGSDSSSRPSSHLSQYAHNAEQNRTYYTGSYPEQYQMSQIHQQQQHEQQQQQQQQQHQQQQQTKMQQQVQHQNQMQQHQTQQQQHQNQQQQQHQSQQHQHYQNQHQQQSHPLQTPEQYQQSRQSFEFSRPQVRDSPSYSQYQSQQLPGSSPYHQSPSPYHQIPSPQQPRAPSREQMVPRVPSREQTIPRVPSHEQLVPRVSARDSPYSETYSYSQAHSYYQQPQPKVATGNISYKPSTLQQYPQSTQQQQNMYYKHIYSPQQTHQSVFAASRQEDQNASHPTAIRTNAAEQTIRTTHNLPPIASLSNYHSSRVSREPVRPVTSTTTSRPRTFSSNSYTQSVNVPSTSTSTIIQPNPAASVPNYPTYRTNSNQQYQQTTTTTTPSYTQVIMTTASAASTYYSTNQSQSSNQYQHPGIPRTQTAEQHPTHPVENANSRIVKRESPLDLSVKTVRTPADSTLGDAEQDARNKYLQNQRQQPQSLSALNYPQLDVTFQRNVIQRSAQTAATAPKFEFRPNFSAPNLAQPRRPLEEPRRSVMPEKAHSSNKAVPENKSMMYRYPTASIPTAAHVNSYIRAAPKAVSGTANTPRLTANDILKKRPGEVEASTVIPNKVPKVADAWRHSIDLQIEERLSNYKQQQEKLASPTKVPLVNGNFQDKSKNIYPGYEKPNYESTPQHSSYNSQYPMQANHLQTYVPSPGTHQYPGYPTQASNLYLQPTSRSNSNSSINTLGNSKNSLGGAVDKRVLSLLRNSLEVNRQKKLEQMKSNESIPLRSDVQHPSTDVTAPLQPKPGFVSRNNVSPFTPTSFPDNSNMAPMYKFHIPKAIDSINFDSNKTNQPITKQTSDTVITNHNSLNPECDGLAAFLAARIRTKGELKQGGPPAQNTNKSQLHDIIENQLKSPIKQETLQNTTYSSSGSLSSSPPKLQKERLNAAAFAPRKRLFSRNDEDSTHSLPPPREPGLRSSSETSVFDFPDSDSENDLNRESLEAMRKGRKTTKQSTPMADVKLESHPQAPSPGDDMFSQLCDNFLEQLKSGVGRKKPRRRKDLALEISPLLESISKENPFETEVIVKAEKVDEENPTESTLEVVKPKVDSVEIPSSVNSVNSVNSSIEIDLTKVKSEPISNDLESKEEDLFLTKRRNVRRRLLSSSDSSDNEEVVIKNKDKQQSSDNKDNKAEEVKVEIEIKKEKIEEEIKSQPDIKETNETAEQKDNNKENSSTKKSAEVLPVNNRPFKKPSFGDGSDFYPGWEEGVYKYKKSLRMPPTLIQVNRPPAFHRLSTSLPDLDPCPQSPSTSISTDDIKSNKINRVKSEPPDSDTESNSSFNIFNKKTNYDSEGGSSIRSLPNTAKEMSILDRLLEKCGGRKRKKYKRKDDHSPKIVPKSDGAVELMATPSLEIKEEDDKKTKKLSNSPVIKTGSPLLGFRKSTISNFKDAFIKRSNNILNNQFTTVVLNSRTRRETRVQKQRATIKEVFGEDRPASAPPVTCVNDIQIKEVTVVDTNLLGNLVVRLDKKDAIMEKVIEDMKKGSCANSANSDNKESEELSKNKIKDDILLKTITEKTIKTEVEEDSINEDDTRSLDDMTIKSETPSIDGDDGSISGKKRGKFGKMRRKLSSGFDYIRKKKKVKKENIESDSSEKKKKKIIISKTLESVDDIQKEIKTWVLNKGIGETHLHRAARLGYTDVTAYCLEKMECNPSPRDNAGYTPLHWACSKGHLEIAKLLLLYGANPSESAQGGIRPLHEAVENGFVEIARLLLSYGADPNLATYSGLTPLALTNDEVTKDFLKNHLNDIEGEPGDHWVAHGPSSNFDPVDQIGYNVLEEVPVPDPESEEEDIDIEMSECLLPNLYTLNNEPPTDRWVLLQDLSNFLKIKSRDALLKQICPPSTSGGSVSANAKTILRELKMTEFLEQARCCQFLNAGEKINTRASKIALIKYTDKVRELLNVDSVLISAR